ncbi:ABC transporter substrate-binding protein [Catalinimonas niigatensis]|uniref:ABC transporter substrate-binding protein n=1 Tax=Catalinimonas niigatensis TaxID=1397264 RepID=UPI002665ECD1|nr:ABC transporter substrate-binding protein [Catalinimonas niigatensis]WPP52693.1 ABC transporter substrate-binding protein [Catalinimonas niigatensis]
MKLLYKHILLRLSLPRFSCTYLFALVSILFCACENGQEQQEKFSSEEQSLWTEETQVSYAQGFAIGYEAGYKVLHLMQGSDTTRYLLLPEGTSRPEIYPEAQVIYIPIRSLVALSTTHVALADFVEADSIIIGLDNTDYVYDPEVRARIEAGEITEVGKSGSLNQEMVLALQPDLLMVSGMPDTDLQKYSALTSSGIPVLINTEWMESTALGKAEWVKLMAALLNQEELANAKFDSIATAFQKIVQLTDTLEERPAVLSGSPFQGSWYVPGGKSDRSKLFVQAGAHWPWNDTAQVSLPIAFESMYAYGLETDYWLNPGMVNTLDELLAMDERFGDFKSFQDGEVYNHNRRMSHNGQGNDFYESGVVNPHLVLADLTYILHPELLPEHALYYYQQLK